MEKIVVELEVKSKKGVKEVEKLNKGVKQTSKEVSKTKKEIKETNASVGTLGAGALGAFNKFKTGVLGVVKGFKSLKFAIIATGIGALLVGILAVKTAFTSSEEGQNKFAKILGVIGSITGNLIDIFADLGSSIISVFENPKQAIIDLKNLIVTNITNRFESLIETVGFLGSAFKKVFSGDFSGAMDDAKKAGNSYIDTLTGVKDTLNKVTEGVKEMSNEIAKDAKDAANIADQRAKADKIDRKNIVERAKANQKISELRFKSEQRDKYNAKERLKFLKDASKLAEETTNKEIESAKLRFEAKKLENSLSKSTKDDKNEEARLEAQLISLTTSKLSLQKRLQTSITTFQNEIKTGANAKIKADDLAAKKIKDAQDKKIKEDETLETKRLESIDKIQKGYKEKKEEEEIQNEIEKIELEQTRALAELDRLNATEEQKANIKLYYSDLINKQEQKNQKTQVKLDKIRTQQTIGDAKNSFNQMAQLAGQDSKIGKAMAIASATISGVQGVQNAYTTAQKSPITAFFPAYPVVQSALAGAIALKNISAIKSVNPSGGGGTISAPSAPSVPSAPSAPPSQPPAFNVVGASGASANQLQSVITGQSQQPTRAYVVSDDVTSAQSMDRNIIDGASI